jgi:hypothetical protein
MTFSCPDGGWFTVQCEPDALELGWRVASWLREETTNRRGMKIKRWLPLGAIPVLALAMGTAAGASTTGHMAGAVHTVTIRGQTLKAGPDVSCPSGYDVLQDENGQYLTNEGTGSPVRMEATAASCWKGRAVTVYELVDLAGTCLAVNANLGELVTEDCNGNSYQEWSTSSWGADGPGTQYISDWDNAIPGDGTMWADGGAGSPVVLGTDSEYSVYDAWHIN